MLMRRDNGLSTNLSAEVSDKSALSFPDGSNFDLEDADSQVLGLHNTISQRRILRCHIEIVRDSVPLGVSAHLCS